jgi:hypothetical protein
MRILCVVLALTMTVCFMPMPAMAMHAAADVRCASCHTPHRAQTSTVPLWNGAASKNSFTLYSSSTIDAVMGQPDGASKLCFSCHDGVITGTGHGLGTDLTLNHPVSFVYDSTLVTKDKYLKDPTTATVAYTGGGTLDKELLDANHKVQCTSCHEIHNTPLKVYPQYLRGVAYDTEPGGDNQTLCRQCHLK